MAPRPDEASFDLAVVGLGGMGSAVAYHAAARGLRVLGLERFDLGHTRGSSHGVTRILRLGLHEGGYLVDMARQSLALWRDLGRESGETIFVECGSVDLGPPDSAIVRSSLEACAEHGVEHEFLDAAGLAERIPGLVPDPDMTGVLQPGAGLVACEVATAAHQCLARERGAVLLDRRRVTGWGPDGEGWRIETDAGPHRAARVVVCPGAFAGGLLDELRGRVRAERQVIGWFHPREDPALFAPDRMPCWILDGPLGHFYGLPVHGVPGFKLARLRHDELVDPEDETVPPAEAEIDELRAVLARWFPGAGGPLARAGTCLLECTPDRVFVMDELPGSPGVFVAAGFSGHGFKYAAVVGRAMAAMAVGDDPGIDMGPFRLDRLTGVGTPA